MSINRLLTMSAGVGVVAVLLLGWLLGISPKLGEIAAADAETATARAQNAALEASNSALRVQLASIDEHRGALDDLLEAVPAEASTDDFVDDVERLAAASDVVLQSVTFGEGASYGTSADGAAPVVDGAVPAPEALGGLVTLEVDLTVAGEPENAMRLVEKLQTGDRLFAVTRVTSDAGPPGMTTMHGYLYVLL